MNKVLTSVNSGGGRNLSLDIAKGILILLVVVGHLFQNSDELRLSAAYSWIYTFHMPAFMFVSGYVAKYSFKGDFNWRSVPQMIGKKFRALIIPSLFWALFSALCFTNTFEIPSVNHIFTKVEAGYWFMPCLFLLYMYLMLAKFAAKEKIWCFVITTAVVFVVAAAANKYIPTEITRTAFSYYIPFFLGYSVSTLPIVRNLFENKLIFAFCLIVYCLIEGHYSKVVDNTTLNKVVRLLSGLAALPVLWTMLGTIPENRFTRGLAYIGKHSLSIYMLHYFFIGNVGFAVLASFNPLFQISVFSIYAILISFVCIAIEHIFCQYKWLAFVSFGKSAEMG